jgi:hypothetical protein
VNWFSKLIADSTGAPSEHIVLMILGIIGLNAICVFMIWQGHTVTLSDYGMAHGAIVTGGGAGQFMSKGN